MKNAEYIVSGDLIHNANYYELPAFSYGGKGEASLQPTTLESKIICRNSNLKETALNEQAANL